MNRNLSIKLKALFLLIVFATNTVVGFACAIGVNMDFNTSRHNQSQKPARVHIHDGKKHVHEKETSAITTHVHANGIKHQHKSEPVKQITTEGGKFLPKDDGGCCASEVQEFQHLDKNIVVSAGLNVPVFVAILSTYFDIDFSAAIRDFPVNYKSRFYYPPPPDLRIAIQRFQI